MFKRAHKTLQFVYDRIWREINLRTLTNVLIVIAIAFGAVTYLVLTNRFSFINESRVQIAYTLFFVNIILLSVLALLLIARVVSLFFKRKKGIGASRFHSRLALIFSAFAIIPTIIAGFFASALYEESIQKWFDNLTKGIILESSAVSEIYSEEHLLHLKQDAIAIAQGLLQKTPSGTSNKKWLAGYLTTMQEVRNLNEIALFDENFEIIASAKHAYALRISPFNDYVKNTLKKTGIVGFQNESQTRLRVMAKIHPSRNIYIVVGRNINPKVLSHLEKTIQSKEDFRALEERRWQLWVAFIYIYGLVTLFLLIVSVVVGLTLADYIAEPVEQLIAAAHRIRAGDWTTKIQIKKNLMEFLGLARAFNKMMQYINAQKQELEKANYKIEERRRFIEITLSGVSAGVVSFSEKNKIQFYNSSASKILKLSAGEKILGKNVFEVFPPIKELLVKSTKYPNEPINENIEIEIKGIKKYLHIRITAELLNNKIVSQVITFDDLTELISAQRKAAWGDVARRVAHEIKNPLTPIQLSAERIGRKFSKYITDDKEVFDTCIDTISRKVADIYRIVYEFSSFARLPQVVKKESSLKDALRKIVNQMTHSYNYIDFEFLSPEEDFILKCDEQILSQAFVNIIKNAVESIDERLKKDSFKADIQVRLKNLSTKYIISFKDNGLGFSVADPNKYLEPYITTKSHGSGLGLSIVKKIIEEHDGRIHIKSKADHGAEVLVELPKE